MTESKGRAARLPEAVDQTLPTEPDIQEIPDDIPEEEFARAQHYTLLARFLAVEPDAELLQVAAGLTGDETPLGIAMADLARVAARTSPRAAREEYQALFIGLGRGELVPHGSFYLTGFLNEKPLAALRADLAVLGVGRAEQNRIPEDHAATLCEIMAGLIGGSFGAPLGLAAQRTFFGSHIGPWMGQFFEDLETAESADLYVPIGMLGRRFLEVESLAFQMLD
ncbi:TorD/DmsD family molecular chaperone [Oceanibacterium hippocampi]|uniref:Chaperone protein TorD n=1 Tax=Oceanibacterium hippocampi TaxID=745714 RepID=A0A1Y5TCB5_9PROT|nr:molecular chaperone TorD family protein [Oceanibacterium hippocampi]SLN60486.1 chaperone protein TorD [Oceanibacterium hippocampi]